MVHDVTSPSSTEHGTYSSYFGFLDFWIFGFAVLEENSLQYDSATVIYGV